MTNPGQPAKPRPASGRQRRDLALDQQLASDGIAAADRRGGAVDHATARRISLLLTSQTRDRRLARDLTRFARDGSITRELKNRLRDYARTPGHRHQPQAARLLQYAAARGPATGPVSTDFAAACDHLDRQARTTAEPPDPGPLSELDPFDLAPPDSEWFEPDYPDPAPGFATGARRPAYVFTLAASPWFKEHYPDQAANLFDALRAGRDPQPDLEPGKLADREAGE